MNKQQIFALFPNSLFQNSPSQMSETASQSFFHFISTLSSEEQLTKLDQDYLQSNFNLKETHSSLTLKGIENIYNNILHKNKQITDKRMKKNWTEEETSLLLWIASIFQSRLSQDPSDYSMNIWEEISQMIPFKTFENCKNRWFCLRKNSIQGTPWTSEEDEFLIEIIKKKGASSNKWNDIAKELQNSQVSKTFRKGKQCRERWNNHLDPDMKRGSWTIHEDLKLLNLSFNHGNKWSFIAKQLKERTENAVKNRYKSLLRREEKESKSSRLALINSLENGAQDIVGEEKYMAGKSNEQKKINSIIQKLETRLLLGQEDNSIDEEDQAKKEDEDNEENKESIYDQLTEKQSNIKDASISDQVEHLTDLNNKSLEVDISDVLKHSIFQILEGQSKFKSIEDYKEQFVQGQNEELLKSQESTIKSKNFITRLSKEGHIPNTFSEAINLERSENQGNKRSSFLTQSSGSTTSSFTPYQSERLHGFSNKNTFQDTETASEKNNMNSTPLCSPFYLNFIPQSPCEFLIQQLKNLGLNSEENTPLTKRKNTYHNSSNPLSTLCYEQLHKQRKLSSMQIESEEIEKIQKNSKTRKVIILAGQNTNNPEIKDEITNDKTRINAKKFECESYSSCGSQITGHSQVGSDHSLSQEDAYFNGVLLNSLNYSGSDKSAFRQFLSPQLSSSNLTSRHSLPSSELFHQINPSPILSSSSQTTPIQSTKGFKRNKGFTLSSSNIFERGSPFKPISSPSLFSPIQLSCPPIPVDTSQKKSNSD